MNSAKIPLEINDSIKSKISKGITEGDVIISLLAKNLSLKVIKAVILSIETYKQDILSVGKHNKKIQSKTNGIIVIICLCYHCWGLITVYPYFIWLKVLFGLRKKERINEFSIGYMINPKSNINKSLREKLFKCMNNIFGPINQPYIKATLSKKTTRVLSLLMFYQTRNNPKKSFKVLSCVIYKIISNYVCIDYPACE